MDFKLFRTLIGNDFARSKGTSRREFKSWLAEGRYLITSIAANGSEIELYVPDHERLMESLGYDFSRFACASFESMREIQGNEDFPKATAWAGIKSYYSAFFAAHAIMRLFGVTCSQIESAQAVLVSKYAGLYGISNKLSNGFYIGAFDPVSKNLKLEKLKDTHKDTWGAFSKRLNLLSIDILTVPGLSADKAEISSFLSAVSKALEGNGSSPGGGWLSAYRNNLNYKQDYNAWYPYNKSSVRFEQISRYSDGWHESSFNAMLGLSESDERLRFYGACSAIVYLLGGLASDLSVMADKSSVHRIATNNLLSLMRTKSVVI